VRYPFQVGQLRIDAVAEEVVPLDCLFWRCTWMHNLLDNGPDSILVTVGSEHEDDFEMDPQFNRSAVLELSLSNRTLRVYTGGLR
jgi:hypothetical protein